MIGPQIVTAMFTRLVAVGVVIGLAMAGLAMATIFLCHHITIGWVP